MPERGGWFLGFIRVRGRLLLVLKDLDGEIEVGGSARAVDVGRERDGGFEKAPLAAGEGRRRNKGPPRNLTALAERERDPVVYGGHCE